MVSCLEFQVCYTLTVLNLLIIKDLVVITSSALKLTLYCYLFAFPDDEALCMASNFRWFNPTSGTRNCNVLPTDMPRNYTKRHRIFQELCNMSSSTSQSCYVELNSWLLSIPSSTRPLKQGSTSFFHALNLLFSSSRLDDPCLSDDIKGYLTWESIFYIGTKVLWWEIR